MPEWLGKTIGKVRIDKYLAHGGMAEVYLGTHLTLDRLVAVKVLHGYIEENADLMARFQREAKVVAGLRHPNIVQVYDFDALDGHPYIVMEYLKGPPLATYLRNLHDRHERIPTHQVARLLKTLTAALDYAHEQGVVHRDIKPGNILLHGKADEIPLDQPLSSDVEAVITDFGLVRITNSASQTDSGMVSGTPSYMSPEQARGEKSDHRSDIYSLGIVLYEMLAGRVPFEAESTLSVIYMQINQPPPPIPGISPRVQAVMDRALKKNPDERYQSSREMAVDFYLAIGMNAQAETVYDVAPKIERETVDLQSQEAQAQPQPQSQVQPKPKPGVNRMWIGAGIAAVICLFALTAGIFAFRSSLFGSIGEAPTNTPTIQNTQVASVTAAPPTSNAPTLPSRENMVEVPAGSYIIGRDTADEYHIASQTLQLGPFWIDQFQVTNAQYQQFMDQTGTPAPVIWPAGDKLPVRGVTWMQATAYCAWRMKRLPDEAEWEVAGRGSGPNPQLFPWGDDASHALKLPEQETYEVGSTSFNISPFGLHDLVGNVWEWTGEPYTTLPDGFRILRGGRFGLPQDLAYRLAVATDNDLYTKFAGFRCAADQVQ